MRIKVLRNHRYNLMRSQLKKEQMMAFKREEKFGRGRRILLPLKPLKILSSCFVNRLSLMRILEIWKFGCSLPLNQTNLTKLLNSSKKKEFRWILSNAKLYLLLTNPKIILFSVCKVSKETTKLWQWRTLMPRTIGKTRSFINFQEVHYHHKVLHLKRSTFNEKDTYSCKT